MKIALIVPGGVDRSGRRKVIPALLSLIRRLAAIHEVHVYALYQEPRPGRWKLEGATVHNAGRSLTILRSLGGIAAQNRVGKFDVIQAIWASSCGAIAVAAGKLLRIPSVVHIAGGELVAIEDIDYGGFRNLRGRLVHRATVAAATELTAASQPILDQIATLGRTAKRIPLGVDLREWPAKAPRVRSSIEMARLVHVASLNRVKDQGTLLRAMRKLADRGIEFRLDIVGEDVTDGAVEALSHQLDLADFVTFHGYLEHRELRPIVESADIAVISSRHEAGPLFVLEAAVAGVPTVGTNVGHVHEWAESAALAVDCQDAESLASRIALLLSDEPMRQRLAYEAQARAVTEDANTTARLFGELYSRLSEDKSTRV